MKKSNVFNANYNQQIKHYLYRYRWTKMNFQFHSNRRTKLHLLHCTWLQDWKAIKMKSKKITFLIVLVLSLNASTLAQNTTTKDSTTLYKSIESYSRRNKLTKFIYRMLFRPISSNEPKKIVKKKIVRQVKKKASKCIRGQNNSQHYHWNARPFWLFHCRYPSRKTKFFPQRW